MAPHSESAPIQLPPVPHAHLRLGWSGFALALPEGWNLSLHSPAKAMHRRGLLVFSDLRGPAFEIRWQTPRRLHLLPLTPTRALHVAAARLRKRAAVDFQGHTLFVHKHAMAMVAGHSHLYELHCPRNPESLDQITRDFATCLNLLHAGPCLWSLYAIHAWLPARAQLRDISLRPGDCRLTFHIPPLKTKSAPEEMPAGGTITLAGFSLAHQILRDRSLRAWASAELPHVRNLPVGQWEESPHRATCRAQAQRLGRHISHETHIRHDPALNRIHWTHLARRCKNKA